MKIRTIRNTPPKYLRREKTSRKNRKTNRKNRKTNRKSRKTNKKTNRKNRKTNKKSIDKILRQMKAIQRGGVQSHAETSAEKFTSMSINLKPPNPPLIIFLHTNKQRTCDYYIKCVKIDIMYTDPELIARLDKGQQDDAILSEVYLSCDIIFKFTGRLVKNKKYEGEAVVLEFRSLGSRDFTRGNKVYIETDISSGRLAGIPGGYEVSITRSLEKRLKTNGSLDTCFEGLGLMRKKIREFKPDAIRVTNVKLRLTSELSRDVRLDPNGLNATICGIPAILRDRLSDRDLKSFYGNIFPPSLYPKIGPAKGPAEGVKGFMEIMSDLDPEFLDALNEYSIYRDTSGRVILGNKLSETGSFGEINEGLLGIINDQPAMTNVDVFQSIGQGSYGQVYKVREGGIYEGAKVNMGRKECACAFKRLKWPPPQTEVPSFDKDMLKTKAREKAKDLLKEMAAGFEVLLKYWERDGGRYKGLDHPYAATPLCIIYNNGMPVILSPICSSDIEGPLYTKNVKFNLTQVFWMAHDMFKGLEDMHSKRRNERGLECNGDVLMHRDMKSPNILYKPSGEGYSNIEEDPRPRILLTDFGLTRQIEPRCAGETHDRSARLALLREIHTLVKTLTLADITTPPPSADRMKKIKEMKKIISGVERLKALTLRRANLAEHSTTPLDEHDEHANFQPTGVEVEVVDSGPLNTAVLVGETAKIRSEANKILAILREDVTRGSRLETEAEEFALTLTEEEDDGCMVGCRLRHSEGRPNGDDTKLYVDTVPAPLSNAAGSILWMAPEVLEGKLPGEKVDIYSGAFTLYEIYTGHHPWKVPGWEVTGNSIPHKATRFEQEKYNKFDKKPNSPWIPTGKESPASSTEYATTAYGGLEDLMRDCWKGQWTRPSATDCLVRLKNIYAETLGKMYRELGETGYETLERPQYPDIAQDLPGAGAMTPVSSVTYAELVSRAAELKIPHRIYSVARGQENPCPGNVLFDVPASFSGVKVANLIMNGHYKSQLHTKVDLKLRDYNTSSLSNVVGKNRFKVLKTIPRIFQAFSLAKGEHETLEKNSDEPFAKFRQLVNSLSPLAPQRLFEFRGGKRRGVFGFNSYKPVPMDENAAWDEYKIIKQLSHKLYPLFEPDLNNIANSKRVRKMTERDIYIKFIGLGNKDHTLNWQDFNRCARLYLGGPGAYEGLYDMPSTENPKSVNMENYPNDLNLNILISKHILRYIMFFPPFGSRGTRSTHYIRAGTVIDVSAEEHYGSIWGKRELFLGAQGTKCDWIMLDNIWGVDTEVKVKLLPPEQQQPAQQPRAPAQQRRAPAQQPRPPAQQPRAPAQQRRAPAQQRRAPAQQPRPPAKQQPIQQPTQSGSIDQDLVGFLNGAGLGGHLDVLRQKGWDADDLNENMLVLDKGQLEGIMEGLTNHDKGRFNAKLRALREKYDDDEPPDW